MPNDRRKRSAREADALSAFLSTKKRKTAAHSTQKSRTNFMAALRETQTFSCFFFPIFQRSQKIKAQSKIWWLKPKSEKRQDTQRNRRKKAVDVFCWEKRRIGFVFVGVG
jgi:hypothetical protein